MLRAVAATRLIARFDNGHFSYCRQRLKVRTPWLRGQVLRPNKIQPEGGLISAARITDAKIDSAARGLKKLVCNIADEVGKVRPGHEGDGEDKDEVRSDQKLNCLAAMPLSDVWLFHRGPRPPGIDTQSQPSLTSCALAWNIDKRLSMRPAKVGCVAIAVTDELREVAARYREQAKRVFEQIETCSLVVAEARKTCTELRDKMAVSLSAEKLKQGKR
jgi:hypothetical protein